MDADGFDTLVFPDFQFKIVGIDRYRDRLVEFFPNERKGIDRYCRLLREVRAINKRMDAPGKKSAFGMLSSIALQGRLLARFQNATIGAFLDTCTQDERLRAVMLGQSGDYGLPPSQVSALLHAGLANHYFEGAYYPEGGGQIIADELAEAIEEAGGSIHLRCGVEKVLFEGGRAVGVKTQLRRGVQHEVRAKVVLSNADLKRTWLELVGPEHAPAEMLQKVNGYTMGGAIFMTFLGVEGDLGPTACHTNYWCFDSYDMEAFYNEAMVTGWSSREAATSPPPA